MSRFLVPPATTAVVPGARPAFSVMPASAGLFRWTERCAEALGVPRADLGPLAMLCWLHHGRSGAVREAELSCFQEDAEPVFWLRLLERVRDRWLSDPALGPEWAALPSR